MKMEQMATKLSAKYTNGAYRGDIDGYDYQLCVVEAGLGVKQYYMTFIMNQSVSSLQVKAIKKQIGGIGVLFSSVIQEMNTISLFIRNVEKTKLKAQKLVEFFKLNEMKTLSKEIYLTDEDITSYKQIPVKLQQGLKFNVVVPINDTLFKQKVNEMLKDVKESSLDQNNLVGGILFAIIGAVIGIIPSVIAYELGFMSWFLYIIVPFSSFYGYKYAKGPQHGWVPLLIGFITLLVSVSAFMYTWFSFAASYSLTLTELFEVEGALAGFIEDGLFLFIGNIVGIAVSYKSIYSRTTAAKLKDIESMK